MSTNGERAAHVASASGAMAAVMAGLTVVFSLAIIATRVLPDLYPLALAGILASVVTVPLALVGALIAFVLGCIGRRGAGRLAARRGMALAALSLAGLAIALVLQNMLGSH